MAEELRVEAVRTRTLPGWPVVYWRYYLGSRCVGSVTRKKSDGSTAYNARETLHWRVLTYGDKTPRDNQEVGEFLSRKVAEAALEDAVAARYGSGDD